MGLPIALKLTDGQAHDGRSAEDIFDTEQAGNILLADRAYDSNALRERLAERGAWRNIRAMPHHLDRPAFSHTLYKKRNAVDRFFNKLKHLRAVSARYDKRDDNYLASIKLASLRIWLRFNEKTQSLSGGQNPTTKYSRQSNAFAIASIKPYVPNFRFR